MWKTRRVFQATVGKWETPPRVALAAFPARRPGGVFHLSTGAALSTAPVGLAKRSYQLLLAIDEISGGGSSVLANMIPKCRLRRRIRDMTVRWEQNVFRSG